jgi:hypothetical protein
MIDKAKDALSTVSDRASEQIETRLTDVAAQVRTRGNEQVERIASYLENADVRQISREVESFARRNPAAFVAGAFVVGFAASRFLKASGDATTSRRGFSDDGINTVDDLDRQINYEVGNVGER